MLDQNTVCEVQHVCEHLENNRKAGKLQKQNLIGLVSIRTKKVTENQHENTKLFES